MICNLHSAQVQRIFTSISLCSNYAKSFVDYISAQLALLAVLIRYIFGSTFTGTANFVYIQLLPPDG